ncbi:MAG: hypothetical protein ACLUVC_03630 [Longibaculum sp.]
MEVNICPKARNIKFEENNLYGPKLTENIDENDFFIDNYKKAAKQTIEIITNRSSEYHKIKNIIAFLGDRGQGKTSMMRSYTNALKNKNDILFGNQLENYEFVLLNIVDPSTFEDCSNILDVVLGQLFDKIKEISRDSRRDMDLDKRNSVIQKFNNLYSQISIIKDKSLLKRNLDIYEGSIETLTTINDVIKFKANLSKLVEECLDLLIDVNRTPILVIPIDDIDIDISNCYETVETIRKYLNLPNVLILMAAKLEQLHEGIRLENMRKMGGLSATDYSHVYEDIYNMSTKYLLKLLPQNRRIHIPNLLNDIGSLQYNINYDLGNNATGLNDITVIFSELIYRKTGILIMCSEQITNYLFNGNLRDTIDLLACLEEMDEPEKYNEVSDATTYLLNLEKFKDYFLNNWCTNNLKYKSARLIRQLYSSNGFLKNQTLIQMICELIKDKESQNKLSDLLRLRGKKELYYDLSDISYHLNKIENHNYHLDIEDVNQFVYSIKICYTIIMNQLRFIDSLNYNNRLLSNDDISPINKDIEITIPSLMKFIGGRVLKQDILNQDKKINILNKEDVNLSNAINNTLKREYKDCESKHNENSSNENSEKFNYLLETLLMSTTSYDRKRDIYFYNCRNSAISDFYFDPYLFFFNNLYLGYSFHFLENSKGELYKNLKLSNLQNIIDVKESLEFVSRTVLCNFQIYDKLIDFLDIRYLNIENNYFSLNSFYILIKEWLEKLSQDLGKQNIEFFKKDRNTNGYALIDSINKVIEFLEEIIKYTVNIKIEIAGSNENNSEEGK